MFKEIHFSTLPSTHRYALEHLRPYTLITAREQTEGIGRKGTAWHAKGDNFLGSFVLPTPERDPFGKLLAAGISIYLAMHVIINVGMMCGILPITGVPLILISYGGSSVLSTMAALGLLQSIYSRRFTFS